MMRKLISGMSLLICAGCVVPDPKVLGYDADAPSIKMYALD